jgi:hypothetical protein
VVKASGSISFIQLYDDGFGYLINKIRTTTLSISSVLIEIAKKITNN